MCRLLEEVHRACYVILSGAPVCDCVCYHLSIAGHGTYQPGVNRLSRLQLTDLKCQESVAVPMDICPLSNEQTFSLQAVN